MSDLRVFTRELQKVSDCIEREFLKVIVVKHIPVQRTKPPVKSKPKIRQVLRWEDLLTPKPWCDFYNRLDPEKKKIYDAILIGIIRCQESVIINTKLVLDDRLVGAIYHYVLWDNPAIFEIGEYAMWKAVRGTNKVEITSLYHPASYIKNLRTQLVRSVQKFMKSANFSNMNDLQKEKYVHDYMIRNCKYDYTYGNNGSNLASYTIHGALIDGLAVCEGIAKSTKLFLELIGVHAVVVSGKVISVDKGHAWNMVMLGGKAYHLDVTQDMSSKSFSGTGISYEYFNLADDELRGNRTWGDDPIIWECTSKAKPYWRAYR